MKCKTRSVDAVYHRLKGDPEEELMSGEILIPYMEAKTITYVSLDEYNTLQAEAISPQDLSAGDYLVVSQGVLNSFSEAAFKLSFEEIPFGVEDLLEMGFTFLLENYYQRSFALHPISQSPVIYEVGGKIVYAGLILNSREDVQFVIDHYEQEG